MNKKPFEISFTSPKQKKMSEAFKKWTEGTSRMGRRKTRSSISVHQRVDRNSEVHLSTVRKEHVRVFEKFNTHLASFHLMHLLVSKDYMGKTRAPWCRILIGIRCSMSLEIGRTFPYRKQLCREDLLHLNWKGYNTQFIVFAFRQRTRNLKYELCTIHHMDITKE